MVSSFARMDTTNHTSNTRSAVHKKHTDHTIRNWAGEDTRNVINFMPLCKARRCKPSRPTKQQYTATWCERELADKRRHAVKRKLTSTNRPVTCLITAQNMRRAPRRERAMSVAKRLRTATHKETAIRPIKPQGRQRLPPVLCDSPRVILKNVNARGPCCEIFNQDLVLL